MRKRGRTFKYTVDRSAVLRTLQGVQPLVNEQVTDIGVSYYMALQSMLIGKGHEDHFHTLAGTINIAMVLCEYGYEADSMEDFKAAQDALMHCWRRHSQGKRFGFAGEEIGAVRKALQLHDEQMAQVPQRQMLKAVNEVIERKQRGHLLETVPV